MPEQLDAKSIQDILKNLTIKTISENKLIPTLAIIRLGADKTEKEIENNIRKSCTECGIKVWSIELPGYLNQNTLTQAVKQISIDKKIDGIKVICPKQYDLGLIGAAIGKEKDIDGFTFLEGGNYAPCEIASVLALIDYSDISCENKNIAIISDKEINTLNMKKMLAHRFCSTQDYTSEKFAIGKIKIIPDIIISFAEKQIEIPENIISDETVIIDGTVKVTKDNNISGSITSKIKNEKAKTALIPDGINLIYPYILTLHLAKISQNKQNS